MELLGDHPPDTRPNFAPVHERTPDVDKHQVSHLTQTKMEQINKIEIVGLVGNIRHNVVSGSTVANFSVATNYAYKGRDGSPYLETVWFAVCAWEGKNMPDLTLIRKGSAVHVTGRVRFRTYTTSEGTEKQEIEVKAQSVKLLDPDVQLTPIV